MSVKKIELTRENFKREVLESENPVVVEFWASWSNECKDFSLAVDDLADKYGGGVKFGKVNIDEEGLLTMENNVNTIPALYIFKDGEVVSKCVGSRNRDELDVIIQDSI
jgi:thioredoxin 1